MPPVELRHRAAAAVPTAAGRAGVDGRAQIMQAEAKPTHRDVSTFLYSFFPRSAHISGLQLSTLVLDKATFFYHNLNLALYVLF